FHQNQTVAQSPLPQRYHTTTPLLPQRPPAPHLKPSSFPIPFSPWALGKAGPAGRNSPNRPKGLERRSPPAFFRSHLSPRLRNSPRPNPSPWSEQQDALSCSAPTRQRSGSTSTGSGTPSPAWGGSSSACPAGSARPG